MTDKKIDLINQMLAKAASTTPEEAEALTAAAEKLMIKYAIDQNVLDARKAKTGQASDKIVEHRLEFTGAYRGELINLAWRVSMGLGLRFIQKNTSINNGKTFVCWVVGFEGDVKLAVILIESLQLQAAVAVREWWKLSKELHAGASSYDQEKARRGFVYGFGDGAGSRIRDNRKEQVEAVSKGTELVLVSRKAQVEAYMDAKSLRNGRSRTATAWGSANSDGRQAGLKANTGEKSVGHRKAVSA